MKYLLAIIALSFSLKVIAGPNNAAGEISNLTATTAGLLVKMSGGEPNNCAGTPYGWLLVKQEHTAIISVVLAAWASGEKSGTIYTSGRENGTGYCLVIQYDPEN